MFDIVDVFVYVKPNYGFPAGFPASFGTAGQG